MDVLTERAWSLAFSAAIAVLMAAVLISRSADVPLWVLIIYPAFGAVLAQIASRTSPNPEQLTWIEAGAIAAASVVVLAGLVNLLITRTPLGAILTAGEGDGTAAQLNLVTLATSAVLLWRVLQQRLEGLRRAVLGHRKDGEANPHAIPAE